jgi:hypothetical protein
MDLIFPVSGDNYGGVDRFWFIREQDISHVDFYERIIPKEGKFWNLARAVKYSLELVVQAPTIRSGVVFEVELRGKIKKYRPDLEAALHQMRGERYAIIIKDLNGYLYQIGHPDELLTFRTDQGSGSIPSDNNEYRFSLSGDTKYKPVPWFGKIPVGEGTPQQPVIGSSVALFVNDAKVADVEPGGRIDMTSDFTLEMLFASTVTAPENEAPAGEEPVQVFFNYSPLLVVPAGSDLNIESEFTYNYQITQP